MGPICHEGRPSPPVVAGQVYRIRAVTTPARLSIYLQLAAPAADEVFREKHPNQHLPSGGAFISLAQYQVSRRVVSADAGSPTWDSSGTKVWVAVETTAAFRRGATVTLNGSEQISGDIVIHTITGWLFHPHPAD